MSATIKLEKKHFPVLLDELISIISPHYGGTFIDCTFGQGGYSKKILENKSNSIIAIDRDEKSHDVALSFKKKYNNRFNFFNKKFSEIKNIKFDSKIKGIIFDLGYSINQINDPSKGISFKSKGKLNMKMGLNAFSAHEVINKMTYENLAKIFKFFGEENNSKKIAKKIARERHLKDIKTEDLVKIIESIKRKKTKINKSTKVFQALRIFVNEEISQLINGLIQAYRILPIGGIIAVVTFHSIEDRIVKFFFKNYSEKKNTSRYLPNTKDSKIIFELINKKPIVPSKNEIINNQPSRSAKLRCAKKTKDTDNFEEFIKKFEYLINIENLSKEI